MSVAAVALVSTAPASAAESATGDAACPAVLNYTFNRLQTGKPESLCQFRGKVLLIVNTASYCGYTHQYEGLEALYRRYKSRGLVVVGFPSNDFGAQEPGSNQEIAEFCRLTYGVEFPMFEKTSVTQPQDESALRDAARPHRAGAAMEFPQVSGRSQWQSRRKLRLESRARRSRVADRAGKAAERQVRIARRLTRDATPFPPCFAPLTGVGAVPYNYGPFGELAQLVRAEES